MRPGRFIAVVGPSGVGKDSVMEALAQTPTLALARRVITRPTDAGGETFDGVTVTEFQKMEAAGAFAVQWQAHGLHYGIPCDVDAILAAGTDVLANLSRSRLRTAADRFVRFNVLSLTASPEVLASRLSARGRETPEDIAARLARTVSPLPQDLHIWTIDNSGPLEDAVATALACIYPERGTR